MPRASIWLATVAAVAAFAPPARGATLEPVGSFADPVFVTSEPNDPDRLLVVEQAGRVMLSAAGVATPYLDLTGLVGTGGERGLLSVAPAPDYAASGLIYALYTRTDGDLQIDEFRASGGSASAASRRPLLTIEHSSFANHNGGQLQFGPDGYLYIATGDGGGRGDPLGSGQNTSSLLGKILRIDPRPAAGAPYSVPSSNPFAGGSGGAPEVWSYGLRNPWRFSFDRATGDLVIGDVGQRTWEEVDYSPAPEAGRGLNFGWNRCEGLHAFPETTPPTPCPDPALTSPVHEYPHTGGACSITGGYVVRDPSLGDLAGRYLFADVCTGRVDSIRLGLPSATDLRTEPFSVPAPSFGEDACGRVYLASLGDDAVSRLRGDTEPSCQPPSPGPGPEPPPVPDRCGGLPVTRANPDGGRLSGTPGDDVIAGGPRRDRIRARGGNDVICGLAGADVLRGGPGADVLRGGPGADEIRGGPGRDRCRSAHRTRSC